MGEFFSEKRTGLLCVELNTGSEIGGLFDLSERSINTYLFRLEKFFYINGEEPIFLRTEKNDVVSLHGNITTIPAHMTRHTEPVMCAHLQKIQSVCAIIGHDKWETSDVVRRVNFQVAGCEQLARHEDKYDAVARETIGDYADRSVFTIDVGSITVSMNYGSSFSIDLGTTQKIEPVFEIEFRDGTDLDNYLENVASVVSFLSFALGTHLQQSNLRICRLSKEDFKIAVERSEYVGAHSAEYIWWKVEREEIETWIGHSPFRAWDDVELASLADGLKSWVARHHEWRNANALMMESFAMQREVSADRLLVACRWLEEIPNTRGNIAIPEPSISEIAEAATDKAGQLGFHGLSQRIGGAIKSIKSETNKDRIARLVETANRSIQSTVFDSKLIDFVLLGLRYRGRAAHGLLYPEETTELRNLHAAILATEALCFALTATELPINDDGFSRIRMHPRIQHFAMLQTDILPDGARK